MLWICKNKLFRPKWTLRDSLILCLQLVVVLFLPTRVPSSEICILWFRRAINHSGVCTEGTKLFSNWNMIYSLQIRKNVKVSICNEFGTHGVTVCRYLYKHCLVSRIFSSWDCSLPINTTVINLCGVYSDHDQTW